MPCDVKMDTQQTVIHHERHCSLPNVLRTKTKPLNDNLKASSVGNQ